MLVPFHFLAGMPCSKRMSISAAAGWRGNDGKRLKSDAIQRRRELTATVGLGDVKVGPDDAETGKSGVDHYR